MSRVLKGLLLGLLVCGATAAAQEALKIEGMGGGGPTVGWLQIDLAGLNDVLAPHGFGTFPNGILVFGGGGLGGLREGVRLGGFGLGGDAVSSGGAKLAKLEVGFGGIALAYGVLGGERYDVSVGALIGGGDLKLDLLSNRPGTFEEAVREPTNTVLSREFFALHPFASVGVRLLPWLTLRVQGGFLLAFPGPWRQSGLDLPGPPSDLTGWTASVGIEFGAPPPDGDPSP